MNRIGFNNPRGRGGSKRPFNNGSQISFSLDCYCIYCGTKILNQALTKELRCSNASCKMPVSGRTAASVREGGWVHCRACDRWIHPTHLFCMNCGDAGNDGKAGFIAARRELMSRNPNAVASGQSISLAELGGEQMLGTPKKKVKTNLVVVYPKPADPFNSEGDKLLGEVPENITDGNDDNKKSDTHAEIVGQPTGDADGKPTEPGTPGNKV